MPFTKDKSAASRNTFNCHLNRPPSSHSTFLFAVSPLSFRRCSLLTFPLRVGPRIFTGNEDTFIGIPERRTVGTCSTPRRLGKCNYADALNYRSASAIVAERVYTRRSRSLSFRFAIDSVTVIHPSLWRLLELLTRKNLVDSILLYVTILNILSATLLLLAFLALRRMKLFNFWIFSVDRKYFPFVTD